MRILESRGVSCGIFWYDVSQGELVAIHKPCDLEGNVDSVEGFNAKSGKTYNHEKTWPEVQREYSEYRRLAYNYLPRGRVMVSRGRADVYLSPHLLVAGIQQQIIREFGLSASGLDVIWHADGSNHYKCYLDER